MQKIYYVMYQFDFKLFRKQNKMTQKAAAKYFKVDQSFISMIETGRNKTPDWFLSKILADDSLDKSMLPGHLIDPGRQGDRREQDFSKIAESNLKIADAVQTIANTNSKMYDDNRALIQKITEIFERLEHQIERKVDDIPENSVKKMPKE